MLAENGCKKINFAGGEPTLHRDLPELIRFSKELGLFVSIISNGTGLNQRLLDECAEFIDIIGLSIDSGSDIVENELGRCLKKSKRLRGFSHVKLIQDRADMIKELGIKLKINTTITPLNWNENLIGFIKTLAPLRWKVFEVNKINEINENFFEEYGKLNTWQFNFFIQKHSNLNPIFETSDLMMNSYCMISPDGCFFQNSAHSYHYSPPILKEGPLKAFDRLEFDLRKFKLRKGDYYKRIKS